MNAPIYPLRFIGNKIHERRLASAIEFVREQLRGKYRKTGEEIFMHSYRMFQKCLDVGIYDEAILAGALLHDIIEDGEVSLSEIRSRFGEHISCIVEGMTGVDEMGEKFAKADYFILFRRYSEYNWRVLFIKLIDCIDNLETIHGLSREKQELFKREKREVYLPIFEEYADRVPFESRYAYTKNIAELRRLLS